MTIADEFIIHEKCGLPIELCVCGLCGKDWVAVHPPGTPYKDFECVKCKQQGYIKPNINKGEENS